MKEPGAGVIFLTFGQPDLILPSYTQLFFVLAYKSSCVKAADARRLDHIRRNDTGTWRVESFILLPNTQRLHGANKRQRPLKCNLGLVFCRCSVEECTDEPFRSLAGTPHTSAQMCFCMLAWNIDCWCSFIFWEGVWVGVWEWVILRSLTSCVITFEAAGSVI